ncbi:TetR/AcrR family transcriptional regulator [Mesorhizobium sp. BR1-1-16]|uniref:TetR/AcrR family transcriptional regulator n=1 Tax=Mesorhizobium sp. BR1-1-16 TaxID=2876653 RepID=UPI001CCFD3E7|nr:TetR/AcrR family transcriptional regulator [Mesorhizobium sp. BR1-1-16]MBZ9935547.1 TetR/AcrR family transcriptional regulator [Mesorhizobium sp. BR1-1-16]
MHIKVSRLSFFDDWRVCPRPVKAGKQERGMTAETYHQRIKQEKRSAAIHAAMELFLEQGYERTSLQQIAKRADLSTATLFKRFPTKAALFEAIVEEFWSDNEECGGTLPVGNPVDGLRKIGLGYASRMRQPDMQAIYRLIIAEALRFPDLGQMLYDKGKGPYQERLNRYLIAEVEAGNLAVDNIRAASGQFLALIAGQSFWPELIAPGCGGTDAEMRAVVDNATALMLARYGR